jgi:hypothetical protein
MSETTTTSPLEIISDAVTALSEKRCPVCGDPLGPVDACVFVPGVMMCRKLSLPDGSPLKDQYLQRENILRALQLLLTAR